MNGSHRSIASEHCSAKPHIYSNADLRQPLYTYGLALLRKGIGAKYPLKLYTYAELYVR